MAWNSKGLRGSTLEELVNLTNESYRAKGLAIVQKVPTPITPVELGSDGSGSRNITLAYFEKKSTVDYIGAAQGLPICFDAKETAGQSLPIQNIHEHQVGFMRDFQNQKGLSFLLVHFSKPDEYFLLPFTELHKHWDKSRKGGRKSIPYADFDQRLRVYNREGYFVHYLQAINAYFDILDSMSPREPSLRAPTRNPI